jgi:hypothetical protein
MPTPWFVLLPLHLREQPEHDRPCRRFLLAIDQGSAKVRVFGFPQYSPIRSARSKSGSIRTWRSSARGAGPSAVWILPCVYVLVEDARVGVERRLTA